MAIATSKLHRGYKGALGDLMFRNYNGKTVVSVRPVYKNETNTEARRQARNRFRDATDFASNAILNTKHLVYYQQKARQLKLPNAYTAAITDYLRKARGKAIVRSGFSAKKGDVVTLVISKSVFRMHRIRVMFYNQHGNLLSEQLLQSSADHHRVFHFTFTDHWPDYEIMRIIPEDEPGGKQYSIHKSEFLRTALGE